MIRSGIVPIDELCGGLQPRSTFLLTGGAGAGKTTLSLQFANEGLRSGESCVILTHGTGSALLHYAEQCGIDLRPALREELAVIVRYRSDFARRLARSGSADRALDDLGRLIMHHRPRRLVIDTFAPLLEDGTPSPLAAVSLAELLADTQTTALLTYPQDVSESYDRRLEPLVQAAAGIFRITRDERGMRQLEIVTLRYSPALESAVLEIGAPRLAASMEVR
jgi:circadian clock protein KaiC